MDIFKHVLSCYLQITQPQNFKGWNDLTVRHIDTFPKLMYPLLMHCAEDLNFRFVTTYIFNAVVYTNNTCNFCSMLVFCTLRNDFVSE